jgi:hypothetical protein
LAAAGDEALKFAHQMHIATRCELRFGAASRSPGRRSLDDCIMIRSNGRRYC